MTTEAHPHRITTEPVKNRVKVFIGEVQVAESVHAIALHEGSLPVRYYMPLHDVRQDLIKPSDKTSHCPFKGDATYRSVNIDGTIHEDILWVYEHPLPEREDITGMLAFYNDRVDIVLE